MSERNVLGNRSWSATFVRVAIVLVIAGILLMLGGALWADARAGLVTVGGIALGIGVVSGLIGVVGSWVRPSGP